MTTEKKFVYLSPANLKKVYDWALQNEETPLGKAYCELCVGMGGFDEVAIVRQTEAVLPPSKANGQWAVIWEVHGKITQARDSLGRVILAHMKRSKA